MAEIDNNNPAVVTAPTQEQLDAWQNLDRYAAASGDSLQNVGVVGNAVGLVFNGLTDSLRKAGVSLNSLSDSSTQAARQAGLLTTAFIGAREAFTNIANVDASRLMTTTDQLLELRDIIRSGPGTSLFASALDTITNGMSRLGASTETVKKVQEEAKRGIMSTASAFFTSADNIKRLQNSMIQMTVSGSGLDNLLKAVGSDFQNLDRVNEKYVNTLNKVTNALGGTKKAQELAASYMATINQIPGGLNLLTKSTEIAGKQTDLLTATLNIAAGSGRKEEDVLADIATVVRQYKSALDDTNTVAGSAADLTARMAEVAGHLGANIKDVHSALMESADAFKMYVMDGADAANMTKGMAESMENYTSSLEAVGVPAANAIEMFKNYTGVMKQMNLGQMAFLSTMSGGAGGLRGAFQIQDEIAKGNFEKLRGQVETSLKRMGGGQIMSREQAMQSEGAAAQYTRQIQTLQQGPLGSLAKTIPEAEALLKAMREGRKLDTTEAAKREDPMKGMQDVMKAGAKIQKDSHGVLVDINSGINTLIMQASLANRRTEREVLGTRNTGALGGGVGGTGAGITVPAGGAPVPTSNNLKNIADVAMDLPRTVKDAWNSLKEVIGVGNKESIQKANDKMLAAIKEQQATWNTLSETQKSAMTTVQSAYDMKPTTETAAAATTTTSRATATTAPKMATPSTVTPKMSFTPIENYARPGQRIPSPMPPTTGVTPGTQTAARGAASPGVGGAASGQAVPVTLAPGSAITVNFTGVCPHCGTDVRHSTTDATVSPQSGAKR